MLFINQVGEFVKWRKAMQRLTTPLIVHGTRPTVGITRAAGVEDSFVGKD